VYLALAWSSVRAQAKEQDRLAAEEEAGRARG
jgi:hypothetical protein